MPSALSSTRTGPRSGRPVVLLHGWACDGADMWPLVDLLAEDHDVLVPDLPGHGGSSAPAHRADLAAYADAVAAHVRASGQVGPLVVGHSMGGAVGLVVADRHPDLVAGVVTVDSTWAWVPATAREASLADVRERAAAVRRSRVGLGLLPSTTEPDPQVLVEVMTSLQEWSRSGPHLGPSHVAAVVGDRGKEQLRYRSGAGPTATHVVGSGHWVHVEHPGIVAEVVRGTA